VAAFQPPFPGFVAQGQKEREITLPMPVLTVTMKALEVGPGDGGQHYDSNFAAKAGEHRHRRERRGRTRRPGQGPSYVRTREMKTVRERKYQEAAAVGLRAVPPAKDPIGHRCRLAYLPVFQNAQEWPRNGRHRWTAQKSTRATRTQQRPNIAAGPDRRTGGVFPQSAT
jgi:hypothetical protein